MIRALPMMLPTGTAPFTPPPPWNRESSELLRLSPMTHTVPTGTLTGSKVFSVWSDASSQWTYGSSSALPSTTTRFWSQHRTV